MKISKFLTYAGALSALAVSLAGCSSVGSMTVSDLVAPGLGITGSTIGAYATRDESSGTQAVATAGGGLAGLLAGLFIKNGIDEEKKDEFRDGYELGQSNATKSMYWTMQSLHKASGTNEKVTYYAIPAAYPSDGANRVPGAVLMPVVEKK